MFIFRIAIIQGVLRKFSLGLHSVIRYKRCIYRRKNLGVHLEVKWSLSLLIHYIYAGVDYTIVETILDRDSFPLKFYLEGIHTTSCMLLPWLKGQNTGWLLLSSTDLFPQDTWNIYVAFLSPPKSISHLEEIAKVRHRFQLQWTVPKSVRNEMVWRDTHYPVHSLPHGQSYFSVSVRTEFCPVHLQAR